MNIPHFLKKVKIISQPYFDKTHPSLPSTGSKKNLLDLKRTGIYLPICPSIFLSDHLASEKSRTTVAILKSFQKYVCVLCLWERNLSLFVQSADEIWWDSGWHARKENWIIRWRIKTLGDYENSSFKIVEGREFSGVSICRGLKSQRRLLLDWGEGGRPCSGPLLLLLLFLYYWKQ